METDTQELTKLSIALKDKHVVQIANKSDDEKIIIIKSVVLQHFGTTWESVNVTSRKMELVRSRQLIAYFIKEKTDYSLAQIGRVFTGKSVYNCGKKDHSTIIHSIQNVKDLIDSDKKFRQRVSAMVNVIDFEIN